jgi:ribose transport system substrate-binding protein
MTFTLPHRPWLFVFLSLLLFAGCTSGVERAGGKKGTIGVSVLTMTNPFFQVIADNLKRELNTAGYDVVVVAGEFDLPRQNQQVRDFITAGHAAIVLCPCNSLGIGSVIEEANQKGIPIFTADIANLSEQGTVVSHIASDNYGGGKQAAHAMIEGLGRRGGKLVILHYPAAESCLLRVKGFTEEIHAYNEKHPEAKIEIVAELPGDGARDKGYKATEDALQSHPDLAGVFAINDPSGLGARAALEKAGKADQVVIVAFDGQPDGKQAIKEGKIYADPIQHPDKIGIQTAQTIIKYLAGEEVPKEQLIPTDLYRQADALKDSELQSVDRGP